MTDWHQEGRRWIERWFKGDGPAYDQHGRYALTHLRALLRLTPTSADHAAAKAGFYARMREINNMSMRQIDMLRGR